MASEDVTPAVCAVSWEFTSPKKVIPSVERSNMTEEVLLEKSSWLTVRSLFWPLLESTPKAVRFDTKLNQGSFLRSIGRVPSPVSGVLMVSDRGDSTRSNTKALFHPFRPMNNPPSLLKQ